MGYSAAALKAVPSAMELLAKSVRKKRPRKKEEEMLHVNCVTWFDIQFPKIKQALFHPPNGGERPSMVDAKGRRYCPEGEKLKRMGVRGGVLDLCLAIPKRGFTGLWIEFKSKNGVWSAEQRAFRTLMQEHRWYVQEITEFEDFVKLIKDYLY